jgi:uncharacterized integral membrane protein
MPSTGRRALGVIDRRFGMSNGSSTHDSRVRTGQTVRIVVWLVVLAALVVFAALNTEKVNVDFGFDTRDVALWLVIAISAAAGIVIGFIGRPRRR